MSAPGSGGRAAPARAKWVALGITALFAVYVVLIGQRAWGLVTSGSAAGVLLGVGAALVGLLCAWGVLRELRFGQQAERLARELDAEGGLPVDDLPRTAAGRVDRAAATQAFERYRAETDAAPGDWRSWFRLGCAYDAAGDRARARAALRHAVRLSRRA